MAVIHINDRMEAYSRAYVHAIAASAGVAIGSIAPDINGLDVHFLSPDDGDDAGMCSHVQLKSTAETLVPNEAGDKRYRLRHVDYDRLRKVTKVPRLLVVLEVPAEVDQWLTCSSESLVLNASARWVSLRGASPTAYAPSTKIPVDLPAANVFTPDALIANMGSLNDK
ncbi:MAG TPA: DUF4365 domain-containing protein [Capillimicrobium sp.]|nr:DUF4365 domain-containing protein [Capillimicrobium sp.]